jgi:uncharacterized protein involved in exopolysaccharide biosynthesis
MQLQAVTESTNRDRDRRAVLERLLEDATAAEAQTAGTAAVSLEAATDGIAAAPAARAADQLEASRAALRALQLRFKPEHPDVVRLVRTIQELEKKVEAEALMTPLTADASAPAPQELSPAAAARLARQRDLQQEIANLDRQIATSQNQTKTLNQRIAMYQQRVEAVPERESEMVALTRDYSTLQAIYTSLLEKNENAKVAANLERRQIGEQFKILDPARLPEKPISPNRTQVNVFGLLGGLVLGLALAALLEYRDTTIRTDDDALVSLSLPVLALIPMMPTKAELRTRRRRRMALAATVGVTVIAWAGAIVWKMT